MRTKASQWVCPIRGRGDFESKDKLNTETNGNGKRWMGLSPVSQIGIWVVVHHGEATDLNIGPRNGALQIGIEI